MSVKQEDIDLKKILDKAAGKTGSEPKKSTAHDVAPPELASILNSAANSVKKKDTGPESTPPSNVPPDGAAPGTTNTTPIKWDDNPLNPVKAATDYEEKRDKTPDILFKDADQEKLSGLLTKHNVAPTSPVTKPLSWIENPAQTTIPQPQVKSPMQVEYDNAVNLETTLKAQLDNYRISRQGQKGSRKSDQETEVENDLQEAQNLKRKAATELVVNGDKEIEVNQRTNEIGNSFNQFMSDLISLNQPIKGKRINIKETEDKLRKMPTQFLTGVNMLKLTEPAEYERVTEAIANGLPVSASQTAKITALGLNLEEAKLQRDILKSPVTKQERQKFDEIGKTLNTIKPDIDKYEEMIKAKQPLSPAQVQDYQNKIQQYNSTVTQSKPLIEKINAIDGAFSKKAAELQKARKENLLDNPEVLRSFIADGVATKLDELGKIKQGVGNPEKQVADFMFGHTWNYSPEQIKWASEQYLKEQGIDPNTPQAQSAIKFLQDNEGVMIGENSIAKAGGFRELGEGLISPITGTAKSIKDIYRSSNDVYAESQSQGNVDVAKKRLASEDTGVRGVVNDVLQGAGQFASQAAIMYATSGGIGAISEGILGKSGVQWLADAKAAGIKPVVAFDDATANLAAGKFLYGIKDPLSVYITSYAMAYDGNLKAALSYTSDNALAKRAAIFNSTMEGLTEQALSPLEIAEGIIHKFSKNQTKDLLKILSDKSLKNDPSALKEYVGKFVKGVLGTAKVSGAEIGEELVTQISDYVTNMYLNPESDSFKSRDLKKELMQTAYQTGLSMAVPAVMNGIGAMRANSFSKGSLMVAAQNRQAIVDNLNTDLSEGRISQEQFNQRSQLVNTAAVANAQLPTKANGVQMDTNEKANYIWSRTTEAYMEKKLSTVTDKAEEEIWREKIKQQQEYRKQILGITEKEPEVPEYTIDDKPVDRKEFLETAEAQPDDHNYVVTGDEEAQQVIRQIGGIDDKVSEPEKKGIPTDEELVKAIESKNVQGYTKTDIKELKEQALQAPASFQNQFDNDEATTVSLIAKNTTDQINKAIEYQQERLKDPDISEFEIEQIDGHIQLLEQGLKQRIEFFPDEANKPEEGKPLSKLEQLKAKRLLSKEEVPGETIDQKLKHISQQPEDFGSDLVALAEKRFPKEPITEPEQSKPTDVQKLTKEAEDLLASIGEGSKPTFITKNLERIAKENGIEVTDKMSADDVINALKEKQSKPTDVEPKIKSSDTWKDVYRKIDNDLLRMPIDEVLPFIEEARNFINNSKDAEAKQQYLDKLKVQEAAAKEELKLKEAATKSGRSYLEPNSWNAPNYDGNVDTYGHVTSSKALYDIVFGNGELDINFTQDGKLIYLNKGGEGQAARIRINGTFGLANLIFDAKALKEAGIEIHKGIEAHTRENIPLKYLTEKSKKAVLDHILNEMDRRGEKPTPEQMQKIAESLGFDNWNNMQEALKNVKSGLEQSISQPSNPTVQEGKPKPDDVVGSKVQPKWSDFKKEENKKGEVWNNKGTAFKTENDTNTFVAKDGNTYSITDTKNTDGEITVVVKDVNGNIVSSAEFDNNGDGSYSIKMGGNVKSETKNIGLAKAIYDYVDGNIGKIKKTSTTTFEGDKLWENNSKSENKPILNEEPQAVKVSAIQKIKEKRVQKKSKGNSEVFSALDEAAQDKKSVREKDIAMEVEAERFGVDGKVALFINRNFDNIVSHLKSNNKIQVKCP